MSLEDIFVHNIESCLPVKGKMLVGVSGGADSMVLMHLMSLKIKDAAKRLLIVHVNHGLRGKESEQDQILVMKAASDMGIKAECFYVDVKSKACESGETLEEAARNLRHKVFVEAAIKHKAVAVVLAHHQQDQVETFFLRLLRGASGRGLCGMTMKRSFPHSLAPKGLLLLRPFLNVSRKCLLSYLKEKKISWREDQSNLDMEFTRNRIRHKLIPYIKKHFNNDNFESVLAANLESLAWENDFVNSAAITAYEKILLDKKKEYLKLDISLFNVLHPALKGQVLSRVWDMLDIPQKSGAHIKSIVIAAHNGHHGLALPGGWLVRANEEYLLFFYKQNPLPLAGKSVKLKTGLSKVKFLDITVEMKNLVKPESVKQSLRSQRVYIDKSKVDDLFVRAYQPGDVMYPLGMGGKKKEVRKILSEIGIMPEMRKKWPVVVSSKGIVWVWQGPIAEWAKVDKSSLSVLRINIDCKS